MDRVRRLQVLRWDVGAVLPPELKENLSAQEASSMNPCSTACLFAPLNLTLAMRVSVHIRLRACVNFWGVHTTLQFVKHEQLFFPLFRLHLLPLVILFTLLLYHRTHRRRRQYVNGTSLAGFVFQPVQSEPYYIYAKCWRRSFCRK